MTAPVLLAGNKIRLRLASVVLIWLASASIGAVLSYVYLGSSRTASCEKPNVSISVALSGTPRKIEPLCAQVFENGGSEDLLTRNLFGESWSPPLSVPQLCHVALLSNNDGLVRHTLIGSRQEALGMLTGENTPKPGVRAAVRFRTRFGVRIKLGEDNGEAHRDQVLATLALQGVSLDSPILASNERHSVRNLLEDSLACFDFHQRETPWTVTAYVLYLPPDASWTNCDGQTFNFEKLTVDLLDRSFEGLSCGGTHLFANLALLVRIDSEFHNLSPTTSTRLTRRVRELTDGLRRNQLADGSWSTDWIKGSYKPDNLIDRNSRMERLLVTGHIMEFAAYLPKDLQLEEDVYRRGGRWLADNLRDGLDTLKQDPDFLCPLAHAFLAVRQFVKHAKPRSVPSGHPISED